MNFECEVAIPWKSASDFCRRFPHASANLHDYCFAGWKDFCRNYLVVRNNPKFIPEIFGGLCLRFGYSSSA
jgi:hypothetical protein